MATWLMPQNVKSLRADVRQASSETAREPPPGRHVRRHPLQSRPRSYTVSCIPAGCQRITPAQGGLHTRGARLHSHQPLLLARRGVRLTRCGAAPSAEQRTLRSEVRARPPRQRLLWARFAACPAPSDSLPRRSERRQAASGAYAVLVRHARGSGPLEGETPWRDATTLVAHSRAPQTFADAEHGGMSTASLTLAPGGVLVSEYRRPAQRAEQAPSTPRRPRAAARHALHRNHGGGDGDQRRACAAAQRFLRHAHAGV